MSRKYPILEISLAATAVGIGACAIWLTGPDNVDFVDSADYLAHAKTIVETGQYPNEGAFPIFRPPLYPLFIAAMWTIIPGAVLAIKAVQIVLFGITSLLIFRTAMLMSGNRSIAAAAWAMFALNPFMILVAVAIQSEIIHIFLVTLALSIAVRMLLKEHISIGPASALGFVLGIAALCKPSALGVGVVIAAVLFIVRFRQAGSFVTSAEVVAAMFLAVLPWALYNLSTKGEFILVSNGGGYNLWQGNLPAAIGLYERDFESAAEQMAFSDHIGMDLTKQQIDEWERTVGFSTLSFKQREQLWTNKALENMAANPGITLKLFGWKLYNYWKPYVSSNIYSAKSSLLSTVFLVPFFALGGWGIFKTWEKQETRNVALLFAAVAVAATAIHVVLISSIRLRLPYVDPFLAVFAAIGLGSLAAPLIAKAGWPIMTEKRQYRPLV